MPVGFLESAAAFITLDPILSVKFLNDPEAVKEASKLRSVAYLASLSSTGSTNFFGDDYLELEIDGLFGTKTPVMDIDRSNCERLSGLF